MPKVAKPRTTNDPEARGDLAVDVARGHPDRPGQFRGRPRDLARCPGYSGRRLRADAVEHRCRCRCRQLPSVPARCRSSTIPAIQETQIAQALSYFDTNFTTNLLWGNSVAALQQRDLRAARFVDRGQVPRSSSTRTRPPSSRASRSDTATGALIGIDAQRQLPRTPTARPTSPVGLYDEPPAQLDPAPAG